MLLCLRKIDGLEKSLSACLDKHQGSLSLLSSLGFPGSSADKESTCSAGDTGLIPGSGRSAGEGIGYPLLGFPCGSAGKESACNAGDLGLIPGLGRSPGEGNGYPFQYSGLENCMDCIVHGVAMSWTQLSDLHFHFPWMKGEEE